MDPFTFIALLLGATVVPAFGLPWLFHAALRLVGSSLRSRTEQRRALLFERAAAEEEERNSTATPAQPGASQPGRSGSSTTTSDDGDWEKIETTSQHAPSAKNGAPVVDPASGANDDAAWEGIVGFFHPFCNAGGGGERVLWAAIRATQERYPRALCVVYTGDHSVDRTEMLANVSTRFNIQLHGPRVVFLYLSTRRFVLASTWPRFTLLGQSLGSVLLAWDALNLMVPDVFVDTMGYAFGLAFVKALFPDVPTGAYVHYPTISTDMLGSLDDATGHKGVNAGLGRSGWKGRAKRSYWEFFAWLYSFAGGSVDVVMTNSSWTQSHIMQLWDPVRRRRGKTNPIDVVFPPVAVEEMKREIAVDRESEASRKPDLLYISQFRPEKNHQLIICAFADFVRRQKAAKARAATTPSTATKGDQAAPEPQLVLAGSVRDDTDKMLVYKLRVLAREQGVAERVAFVVNADWTTILSRLRTSSVGVNGMWNEHFGIGVVEYQAAGLISVVNDSGGPREDIVVDADDSGEGGRGPTGFRASTQEAYALAFAQALALPPDERLRWRLRARRSATRFTEDEFRRKWSVHLAKLVDAARRSPRH